MSNGHTSSRKVMKTLEVVKDKQFPSMLRLQFKEGGTLPSKLSGLYNSNVDAQRAIDYYNRGYDRKKIYPSAPKNDLIPRRLTTNGEAKNTSRI